MRKTQLSVVAFLTTVLLLALTLTASAASLPDQIDLPVGFQPEGIADGRGATFYTGSLVDGAVLRGNFRTGETSELVAGQEGMVSVGMDYDRRSGALFVAGGATGLLRVFDGASGELLETYTLSETGSFINDVIVTRQAAYATNSNEAVFYRLPLGTGGSLPAPDEVETVALSGDWQQVEGFNANGIEAPLGGKWLVLVNSTVGSLYRVDPESGEAVEVDLGSESVSNGDGLLIHKGRLYVVRNMLNEIAVIEPIAEDLTAGEVVDTLTHPDFDVPTTIAAYKGALYAVNAKFGNPTPAEAPYEILRVPLP
ncbi:MAG TPA: hypothetical protein VFF68_13705 [Anaerolineaceae bacterium]|nr:hypothetical protein [Anaerolineaceae bacterium]